MKKKVDVAILGAGSAGLAARRAAKAQGASVVLIDPGPLGTTCARVGCMPSKLLIAAADAAHHAREAGEFGVEIPTIDVDGKKVFERLRRERDRFVGFVRKVTNEAREADELVESRGTIIAKGRLAVDGGEIAFDRLVIATGSTPFTPPPFRGLEHVLLTNENVFELETVPKSAVVIGLGVIGLELGQALHRLGCRTTFLGIGGNVGPIADPKVLESTIGIFKKELDLHPDYELKSIEGKDGGVVVDFVDSDGKARTETYEKVIMAAGRRPNLDLGLESIGVTKDDQGKYAIDPRTLQLGDQPIFVAGDVNNLHPLLHEASDDGKIAGANAGRYPKVLPQARRTPLAIVFSDPQMAIVGTGYRELASCGASQGAVDYGDQGRARVHHVHRGLVHLYADRDTSELVGAEMVGPRVEHLAHLVAWAVQAKLTVDQALAMPFYHPVFEEGIRTALRNLSANLQQGQAIKCGVSDDPVGS